MTIWAYEPVYSMVLAAGPTERFAYYRTAPDNIGHTVTGDHWAGIVFTSDEQHKITSVKLLLYRNGLPGIVTVSIRAVSGLYPVDSDLASGTTDGDTLTTSTGGEWREIDLDSDLQLKPGADYAIIIRCSGAEYLMVKGKLYSTITTNGNARDTADAGVTWTVLKVGGKRVDYWFEEWGYKPL